MKILHTADWQIGRQYRRFDPEDAAQLAAERFMVVERIARLAQTLQVDAVLVAGDVFDSQTLKDLSIRRLFNSLSAYDGPWILLPGNHDAALAESIWTRALRLKAVPANVHLALEPEQIPFAQAGFVVLTAPLTQRQTFTDLTAWFDAAHSPEGLIRIGLAHGSVQGVLAADVDSPNPIAASRADSAGLAYLALGDWHGLKSIDSHTWYSGTPEQERFKDNDAGHVLEVEIAGQGAIPRVTPHRLGRFRWQARQVTLTVESDLEQLARDLSSLDGDDVLELQVDGVADLAGRYRLQAVLDATAARLRAMRTDLSALGVIPTDTDVAELHADGYLAEVIADLRERQSGRDEAVAREALNILAGLLMDRQPQASDAVSRP